MNKFLSLTFSFFALILLSCNAHTQELNAEDYETIPAKPSINIFSLYDSLEEGVGFISLSELYPLGDDTAALSIPNITGEGLFEAEQYTLSGPYRKRFLSKTDISEKDFVFIYDYVHNRLATFAVKDLKIIAILSPYERGSDGPFSPYDYMIGFEVDLKALNPHYLSLAYIGQENPFTQKQLTPLVWQKISSQKFPITTETQDKKAFLHRFKFYKNLPPDNTYLAETNGFQYFLQDYIRDNGTVAARRLLIVEHQTQEIITDKVFGKSEGVSLYPLNYLESTDEIYQWTGKLFKNKPPVIFWLTSHSFGCRYFSVIDKSHEEIRIYCDNRH